MFLKTTLISAVAFAQLSIAGYVLEDDYMKDFYGGFNFFTAPDPTHGHVKYVDQATARSAGLINSTKGVVAWGVDTTNVTPQGRPSIRLESKKAYEAGLVVLDVAHMPTGCGTWPAFWMVGADWPKNGEIDILEGVNEQATNAMTLHTGPGCAVAKEGGFSGTVKTSNCDVKAQGQAQNAGCGIEHPDTNSYGAGLNAIGGGVYATQWTNEAISVWYFPRGKVPTDALGASPDPKTWGKPAARFASSACDIKSMFNGQKIVFDTTFCGDWAGNVWSSGSCGKKAPTCNDYVTNNPKAFTDAGWTINALKVYQDSPNAPPPVPVPSTQPKPTNVPVPGPITTKAPPAPPVPTNIPVPPKPTNIPVPPVPTNIPAPIPSGSKPAPVPLPASSNIGVSPPIMPTNKMPPPPGPKPSGPVAQPSGGQDGNVPGPKPQPQPSGGLPGFHFGPGQGWPSKRPTAPGGGSPVPTGGQDGNVPGPEPPVKTGVAVPVPPIGSGVPVPPVKSGAPVPPPVKSGAPVPPIGSGAPVPPIGSGAPVPPVNSGAPVPPVKSGAPVPPIGSGAPMPPMPPMNSGAPVPPAVTGAPVPPAGKIVTTTTTVIKTVYVTAGAGGVPPVPTGVAPVPTDVAPVPTGVAPIPTGVAPVPTGVAPVPTGAAPVPPPIANGDEYRFYKPVKPVRRRQLRYNNRR